jgi:hypothetical protein
VVAALTAAARTAAGGCEAIPFSAVGVVDVLVAVELVVLEAPVVEPFDETELVVGLDVLPQAPRAPAASSVATVVRIQRVIASWPG